MTLTKARVRYSYDCVLDSATKVDCLQAPRLDDIRGESRDRTHKDAIEVISWGWGIAQLGSAHSASGAGAGRVEVQDISFTKYVDRASPQLIKMCCSGRHFKKARLIVRKAGGNPLEYFKFELCDGIVSAVSFGGRVSSDRLTETVHLHFPSFSVEYTPQARDGTGGAVIPARWNIPVNG